MQCEFDEQKFIETQALWGRCSVNVHLLYTLRILRQNLSSDTKNLLLQLFSRSIQSNINLFLLCLYDKTLH